MVQINVLEILPFAETKLEQFFKGVIDRLPSKTYIRRLNMTIIPSPPSKRPIKPISISDYPTYTYTHENETIIVE